MFKFIVEGYSGDSAEAALADAMGQAAAYMSEQHDVNISILEISFAPETGHKAVLEITIVPMTRRATLHRENADVELKHILDAEYRARRKHDAEHLKHMVSDHFALTLGNLTPEIPDFYTAHLTDATLRNNVLEKEFLRCAKSPVEVPHREPGVPSLQQVLGRPLKPEPGK